MVSVRIERLIKVMIPSGVSGRYLMLLNNLVPEYIACNTSTVASSLGSLNGFDYLGF